MTTMRDIVDRENVKHLVSRDIVCQVSGKVLDASTCTVVRDADGDPVMVLAPDVQLSETAAKGIVERGWKVDRRRKP